MKKSIAVILFLVQFEIHAQAKKETTASKRASTVNINSMYLDPASIEDGVGDVLVSVTSSNSCKAPKSEDLIVLENVSQAGDLSYQLVRTNFKNCPAHVKPVTQVVRVKNLDTAASLNGKKLN